MGKPQEISFLKSVPLISSTECLLRPQRVFCVFSPPPSTQPALPSHSQLPRERWPCPVSQSPEAAIFKLLIFPAPGPPPAPPRCTWPLLSSLLLQRRKCSLPPTPTEQGSLPRTLGPTGDPRSVPYLISLPHLQSLSFQILPISSQEYSTLSHSTKQFPWTPASGLSASPLLSSPSVHPHYSSQHLLPSLHGLLPALQSVLH